MTIQETIDAILQHSAPARADADTVDTLKCGDPAQGLRGIVVTFMATRAVLAKAVELGANFIVTHEPTFYNHLDQTDWLEGDETFHAKRRWIEEHGLAVWRFHDTPHRFRFDAIVAGVSAKLGWKLDPAAGRHWIFAVDPQPARELAEHCKQRLGISQVRVAGDLDAVCTRVGLTVGASGGRGQIGLFRDAGVDAVLCGESPEWETCEYVRDAAAAGQKKALVVLGHANSEEAGMEWVASWLRPIIPADIAINHVPAGDPFQFI